MRMRVLAISRVSANSEIVQYDMRGKQVVEADCGCSRAISALAGTIQEAPGTESILGGIKGWKIKTRHGKKWYQYEEACISEA